MGRFWDKAEAIVAPANRIVMTTPGRAILGTAGQIAGNLAQVNNDAAAQYSSQLYNFVQSAFESPEKFEPDSDFMKQV